MRYLLLLTIVLAGGASYCQVDTSATGGDTTSNNMPIFSLSADDLESETQNQDVSNLLQSSRDVFVAITGYNFSAARFRMRGYNSSHFNVMMNGVPMNDRERGFSIWAYWGGLNDITRYPDNGAGISTVPSGFGTIGGYTDISLRPSMKSNGTRVSYAMTNRAYRHRAMVTHSTGMMDNGWAFTVSGSYRYSDEGYVDGTFFNAGSYFLGAEKRINEDHSIALTGFGAPTVQGRSGIAIQEVYDLTGNNYYNPYWGYQNGEKRNARVRKNHRPSAFLTHYWKIDNESKLTSSIYGTFGKTGSTRLNWFEAKDPRPIYYRYLPSYHEIENPAEARRLTDLWQTDPTVSQIDWDGLYNANYKNLYTLEDANGIEGNDVTFNRSKYILQDHRVDPRNVGINSVYSKSLNENIHLMAGVNVDRYKSLNYLKLEDLLGGDYWVDIDQFAERDLNTENASVVDLDNPNRLVEVGDKFNYNYDMHVNTERVFAQLEGSGSKLEWFAGLTVSHTQFYRYGHWRNGKFPETSGGKGEVHNFLNYGAKGGVTYKINGRHYVTANLMYETKAPYSYNSYVSPHTRDGVVPNLTNMEILSGDVNYLVRYPNLNIRATLFYTEVNDQVWARSFYHDEYRTFINYMMTGVDHLHMGTEIGIDYNLLSMFQCTSCFHHGRLPV